MQPLMAASDINFNKNKLLANFLEKPLLGKYYILEIKAFETNVLEKLVESQHFYHGDDYCVCLWAHFSCAYLKLP